MILSLSVEIIFIICNVTVSQNHKKHQGICLLSILRFKNKSSYSSLPGSYVAVS